MSNLDTQEDDLKPEYDLDNLRVRKLGPKRAAYGPTIRLEPDVAEIFPDASAVNEALRFLMRITKQNRQAKITQYPSRPE